MLERSGLGDDTYVPPWLISEPITMDIAHARLEFEVMCFSPIQELLNKTGQPPDSHHRVLLQTTGFCGWYYDMLFYAVCMARALCYTNRCVVLPPHQPVNNCHIVSNP
jgi:hypothetical protein